MPEPLATPPGQPNEAVAQARAKAERLAAAFEAVLGQPRKRTAEQSAVLDHLAVCAGDDQNAYRFNESKDGVGLIAAGIHRDGAKSILRIIERQLQIAAKKKEPAKAKPKTVR